MVIQEVSEKVSVPLQDTIKAVPLVYNSVYDTQDLFEHDQWFPPLVQS